MNQLEKFYQEELAIRESYHQAKAASNNAGIEQARQAIKELNTRIKESGDFFAKIYKEYTRSRDAGNKLLNFNEIVWDSEIPAIIKELKACHIKNFTYSTSSSGAIKTALVFQKNGCTCEGIGEVFSPYKDCFTGKYEKCAAIFFRIA